MESTGSYGFHRILWNQRARPTPQTSLAFRAKGARVCRQLQLTIPAARAQRAERGARGVRGARHSQLPQQELCGGVSVCAGGLGGARSARAARGLLLRAH